MRVFRHYVSPAKVTIASVDFALLVVSALMAISVTLDFRGLSPASYLGWYVTPGLFALITSPVLIGLGLYDYESLRNFRAFIIRAVISLSVAGLAISALVFLFPILPIWRSILASSIVLSFLSLTAAHILFNAFVGQRLFKRQTAIIGAGEKATAILDFLRDDREHGMVPLAVFPVEGEEVAETCRPLVHGCDKLRSTVEEKEIDTIVIATDAEDKIPVSDLITLRLTGIDVVGHLSFYEERRGYVKLEDLRPEWLLYADGFKGASAVELGAKRALDIFVATALLVLSAPLWVTAGLIVALTSSGGMFYRQKRVGLMGVPFYVLKLRTMVADAEKGSGAKWATANDPRVTPIGRFLRASRIDEIPQVLNVLKGDMSFVGPRPERPEFVSDLEEKIPYYAERHFVKPGITGWAQIRFPYGASLEDARRKLEYDLYYIKNYSLFLDMLIILQTARVVIFQKGGR